MTQNEVDIIKNSVIDATEAYVEARLNVLDFVKTQIGVVVSAYEDSTTKKWIHTVRCNATQSNPNGIVYNNVLSINNIHFEPPSVVFVLAPNAQFSNQFILGKLDNVPYDIVGGSINIGNGQFTVDRNGNTVCKNIDAQGGKIAGFNIGNMDISTTSGNAKFSEFIIGCGYAGRGIVNLVGNNSNAYVQISNDGDATTNTDGIRIYYTGQVQSTRGTGWTTKYFSNIPDSPIYEDSDGYLRFYH